MVEEPSHVLVRARGVLLFLIGLSCSETKELSPISTLKQTRFIA